MKAKPATKKPAAKAKSASDLRDLPAKKNPVGGLKLKEEARK